MDAGLLPTILGIVAAVLLAPTFPGTLYLALLTAANLLPSRRTDGALLQGRIAIVVPAHDEAAVIAHTLSNLLPLAKQDGNTSVVVIADNCSDATATLARDAGARVIARHDPARRGKGYALDHAFRLLLPEGFAAFAVIDADSSVDAHFLPALRATLRGAAAAQARYTVRNGSESPRTQLAELALAGFNVLRPRGRDRLGLSAGILGNGFALRRETLEQVPYTAASVVEDLEYHLQLINAGLRVAFIDRASVRGDMPTGAEGARTQRARWEGGRLRMLREHGAALLGKVLRGQPRFIEPLADLMLLPLAYHVLILGAVLMLAAASGATPVLLAALGSLLVVVAHVIAALRVARLPWSRLLLLTRIPGYLLWKLRMLAGTLAGSKNHSTWVRTNRSGM
ncbi:MAG: glycosyltransferase family 2 protein [Rhodocyclaceae bacterium]|nr:glycosyltransferase family 2 protein [Rhodocyclaceae bacterium]MDZ4216492.1 glycosyltransferase family 2 protein [Rhodocyclaceae bacterium]